MEAMETKNKKSIFDYKHVRGVSAVCLLKGGKSAGRIVANWSDNPAGSVCTASVMLWDDAKGWTINHAIGRAGGYGYDKLSAAIADALDEMGLLATIKVCHGAGNQRRAFTEAGYDYIEII